MHKITKQNGSALILVVVVTVLLAVVGVMFLMISRISEMETTAVNSEKDFEFAVSTVVDKINDVLVEDLFGQTRLTNTNAFSFDTQMLNADTSGSYDVLNVFADEPYDYPSHNTDLDPVLSAPYMQNGSELLPIPGNDDDPWLASLEPYYDDRGTPANLADDRLYWHHITDLWGNLQVWPESLYNQRYDATPVYWYDPDIDTEGMQWMNGFAGYYQVSAFNVPAKVISRDTRMKIVVGNAPGSDPWDDDTLTFPYGARADADGDGIADSRWVQIPNITTSRGLPVYAAIRIIDNCAMLNLNTAFGFYQDAPSVDPDPWYNKKWYTSLNNRPTYQTYHYDGRTLSEINFTPFLRAYDFGRPERIQLFRDVAARNESATLSSSYFGFYTATPEDFDNQFVMHIEEPTFTYSLNDYSLFQSFDISNELEIRNRYLLTSNTVAAFEKRDPDEETNKDGVPTFFLPNPNGPYYGVAYETFDFARGEWGIDSWNSNWKVKVKSIPFENLADWYAKLNPYNFDDEDPANANDFEYDRRHLCTFYSYDRNLPQGNYPILESLLNSTIADSTLREKVRTIFIPKGPATTNIETPLVFSSPYNNVETRKKILHLLYAFRAYYLNQGYSLADAARQSAQIVVNMIDFTDDDSPNPYTPTIPGDNPKAQGPFYDPVFSRGAINIDYGQQANIDCTFLDENIINNMILEVSYDVLDGDMVIPATYDFGLGSQVVLGVERQPFISEFLVQWDGSQPDPIQAIAFELINPYDKAIPLDDYKIKFGTYETTSSDLAGLSVPASDIINGPGRLVLYRNLTLTATGNVDSHEITTLPNTVTPAQDNSVSLIKTAPANSGQSEIIVDYIPNDDFNDGTNTIFKDGVLPPSNWTVVRDDTDWKFAQSTQTIQEDFTLATIGASNNYTNSGAKGFQVAVPDNGYGVSRLHDIERLTLYGHETTADPNEALTMLLADSSNEPFYYDLVDDPNVLEYICPMNRPDKGTLPGRININTAPQHVIAAALPPELLKLTGSYDALSVAQDIIDNRPYTSVMDLQNLAFFKRFEADGTNVNVSAAGESDDLNITDDIEEQHWDLSYLANKFTVRSDVFTAYILLRLGEDGPQRRMIAIFDRSNVWNNQDRPKIIAIQPVPDPR